MPTPSLRQSLFGTSEKRGDQAWSCCQRLFCSATAGKTLNIWHCVGRLDIGSESLVDRSKSMKERQDVLVELRSLRAAKNLRSETQGGKQGHGKCLGGTSAERSLDERFFRATKSLTKNAPEFSPKVLSLYFVGPKESRKIPATFPAKFPSQKYKKITDELLQDCRENSCPPINDRNLTWKLSIDSLCLKTSASADNQREKKSIRNFSIDPRLSIQTSIVDTVFADPVSERLRLLKKRKQRKIEIQRIGERRAAGQI